MNLSLNSVTEYEESVESFDLLMELGDCHTSVGDLQKAQQCYEKAALLEHDEAGPYIGLGVVAFQKKLFDDAEIAFRVACRLDSNSSRGYAGLAMVSQKKEDYKNAFDMYLKCLELDTDNLAALLGLFQVSCQMGSFEHVIKYLHIYLDMHPDDISVMFSLAALYMKQDQLHKCRNILMDILKIDNANEDAAGLLEEVEYNLARKV